MNAHVLVIDDDEEIRASLRRSLAFEGFKVTLAADGEEALRSIRDDRPDLAVLDIMMPGLDGLEVVRRLRLADEQLPVIMLTARDAVPDRVTGLRAGADDYLVKPFDFDELLARIEALLRRASIANQEESAHETLRYADLVVDLSGRTVRRGERDIHLTTREFDLLVLFLHNPEKVLPRSTIMARIWGDDFFGDSNVLEVFVGNVRRALEAEGEPRLIQTVRGVGYVLRNAAGS